MEKKRGGSESRRRICDLFSFLPTEVSFQKGLKDEWLKDLAKNKRCVLMKGLAGWLVCKPAPFG